MAIFEAHHRVMRWDLLQPWRSSAAQRHRRPLQRMAQDLAAVIDHYALDGATVVGHSMGARSRCGNTCDFGHARLSRLVFIDQSPAC